MTKNNEENQPGVTQDDPNTLYELRISRQDLDLIFKFLLKSEIRGFEVPEINKIFIALDPRNYKKVE